MYKSWRQHPTKHQLYGHLPPITKTLKVRRTRHAGHSWRSRDELIRDVLQYTPSYGRAKAGRSAQTSIQQISEDTGCSPEDLPEAMNNREEWQDGSGISMLAARHDDDDIYSGKEFANEQGDWGSVPGRVIPKTQKMVLNTSWLNTLYYKVLFKSKVEQSRERSWAHPYT